MRPVLLAGALGALVLTGCGRHAAPPPVRVHIAAPGDLSTARDSSVQLRGTVQPAGATVVVRGRRAAVSGSGTFSARVDLSPGVNIIDVMASDGSARPALTAVRVRRIITVRVPDVAGLSGDDARTQLEGLGLKVDTQRTGGLIDELLGGARVVCQTDPAAGDEVDAGSTVHVFVGRNC
jgi:hypothetical protein